jgi:hypothetical protein
MVLGRIHMIHTDRVGTKLLHESGIELALGGIYEGIIFDELVGDTYAESWSQQNSAVRIQVIQNLPLTKNCLPSLVKNLEPTAEIVGMALTASQKAAKTRRTEARREVIVARDLNSWPIVGFL